MQKSNNPLSPYGQINMLEEALKKNYNDENDTNLYCLIIKLMHLIKSCENDGRALSTFGFCQELNNILNETKKN